MNPNNGTMPDLEILVRRSSGELAYEVTAADPDLGLHRKSMGKVLLRRDPRVYFQEFFEAVTKTDCFAAALKKRDAEEETLRKIAMGFFEELFPQRLQALLWSQRNRVATLQILADDPWIPWELCCLQGKDNGAFRDGRFLCEAFDMTRWLLERAHFPTFKMTRLALLDKGSGRLPGADRERRALVDLFQRHGQVQRIATNLKAVNAAMTAGSHDAWHFSGHGAYDPRSPYVFLKLEDDRVLTPDDIAGANRNLGRGHPFVFMNCCHSGRAGLSLTGVSGWAHKLIANGVGAFAGTQWAIDDEAAYRFSLAFYRRFLEGCPLGQAVRKARAQIRREGEATWLAFTVFGHPLARVLPRGRAQVSASSCTGPARFDFAHYMTTKTRAFTGRDGLFEAVADFTRENPNGYLHLIAAPGLGKTAFLAALARRMPNSIVYFTNRLAGFWRQADFTDFLEETVRERFGIEPIGVAPASERDGWLLSLASRGPVFILIDGVDEGEKPAEGNLLGLPEVVPEGLYFVLTSREGGIDLKTRSPLLPIHLNATDVTHREDFHRYLVTRIQEAKIAAYLKRCQLRPDAFIRAIEAQSGASFLYAASFLEEIEGGDVAIDPLRPPLGLSGYFQARWQARRRKAGADWQACELPVLTILAALMEAAPAAAIAAFAGLPESRVLRVLQQWTPLLYMEPAGSAGQSCRYRIDHPTFKAFMEDKDRLGQDGVDLNAAHEKIARRLHGHLPPALDLKE